MVGVGEDLIQLKDRLVGQPSKALHVIPIVGMGGIGKTALARNLYDDPSVISHFDACAWTTISQDYNKGEQFSNILSLSYNHLPDHLRPCFLYMGAFPEDYEIRTSRLIKLWAAEGFVRAIPNKSLEEAAKMHLKALVDRNLLFVHRQETKGM
ncbi:UNVERIFIED_CONTAM: putative disease resistance protein [Sesamum latifolium]|uniref:Disease resistance protein n=1 Tax=Sesamum latifolium TaxID=2727402 RepID=A0AAW2UY58_9LAMI